MERPDGYGPSAARSSRVGSAVAVAEMVMRWVVVPVDAGSNPVGHTFGGYSSGTEAGLSSLSDGVSTHTVDH